MKEVLVKDELLDKGDDWCCYKGINRIKVSRNSLSKCGKLYCVFTFIGVLTTFLFLGLFIWAYYRIPDPELSRLKNTPELIKNLDKQLREMSLKTETYENQTYYTCEEFKDEMNVYKKDEPYTPGFMYSCAQINTWHWLNTYCSFNDTNLKDCPHPRKMPGWENFDAQSKLHGHLRPIMVLIAMFQKKHPDFTYHVVGGTALGLLRTGDIIPHDHDVDIVVKDAAARKFIADHLNEFPDDINIINDWKLASMNGCLHADRHGPIGPNADIFTVKDDGKAAQTELLPQGVDYYIGERQNVRPWSWDEDVKPIQKIYSRGYEWNLPQNWARGLVVEYDGRHALQYIPWKSDYGTETFQDKMCKGADHYKFFKSPVEINEEGLLIRVPKRVDVD
jgi:hypothetical protein